MNTVSEKIKFAVIGCGHIGKRHAEMISRDDEAELVALCDVKTTDVLNIEKYEVPFFSNIDELLLSDLAIDVVCICTPNGLHAEHSLKCLDNGKHILCEKPMGLTKVECENVIYKALQVSRVVFNVMQNRYSPPSVWIKDLIDKKMLGKVFMVELNCYWNRDDDYYIKSDWKGDQKLDGGTLFTQFSHFVDIMYWLFGDIKNIQGHFDDFTHKKTTEFEDSGFVTFEFVNGGLGNISYSTAIWDKNMESSMTVIGEKGTVKIGGQYMNEVEYCHIKDYKMPELDAVSPANDYGKYKGSAANHHFIIKNVIDTLKGRTIITTNALEGLKIVDMIERIYSTRKQEIITGK